MPADFLRCSPPEKPLEIILGNELTGGTNAMSAEPPEFSATITRATVPAEHADPAAPVSVTIPLKGMRSANGVIVILYPGYRGDIDGFGRKYEKLALFLQQHVGASLRAGNAEHPHLHYSRSMVNDLR